jgi:hypothetical protein
MTFTGIEFSCLQLYYPDMKAAPRTQLSNDYQKISTGTRPVVPACNLSTQEPEAVG